MKKTLISAAVLATLAAAPALGEPLGGKFGVTGHMGFLLPAAGTDASAIPQERLDARTSFIGGGGIMYGIGDHVAVELEASHAIVETGVPDTRIERTSIDAGFQYRFRPEKIFVPFIGAGAELVLGGFKKEESDYSIDPAFAGYVKVGADYFVTSNVALTTELKQVLGPETDILGAQDVPTGKFNPSGFHGFFGVRLIF